MTEKSNTYNLYKEWFRTKDLSGFISISFWDVGQLVVEIGSVDPKTNKSISQTKCYVDPIEFLSYLNSILNSENTNTYPDKKFESFGGSGNVSRVFKVVPTDERALSFFFKAGHFNGTVQSSGAISPDYSKPISRNEIRRSLLEVEKIRTVVNLALIKHYTFPVQSYGETDDSQ